MGKLVRSLQYQFAASDNPVSTAREEATKEESSSSDNEEDELQVNVPEFQLDYRI